MPSSYKTLQISTQKSYCEWQMLPYASLQAQLRVSAHWCRQLGGCRQLGFVQVLRIWRGLFSFWVVSLLLLLLFWVCFCCFREVFCFGFCLFAHFWGLLYGKERRGEERGGEIWLIFEDHLLQDQKPTSQQVGHERQLETGTSNWTQKETYRSESWNRWCRRSMESPW